MKNWCQNDSSSLTCVAQWSVLVQRNKRRVQKHFVVVFCDDAVVRRLDPWFVLIHCGRDTEGQRSRIVKHFLEEKYFCASRGAKMSLSACPCLSSNSYQLTSHLCFRRYAALRPLSFLMRLRLPSFPGMRGEFPSHSATV